MEDPIPILDQKRKPKLAPIQVVCIVGFGLLLLILGLLCFFVFYSGGSFFAPSNAGDGDAFYRELKEFDALLVDREPFEKPEILNRALDKLEKKALGVESHLSILKRRRSLAQADPRFIHPYQAATQKVAKDMPFSEPLAALAAEALLLEHPSIPKEIAVPLRDYASRLSETKLKPLALSIYVLLGDMQNPIKAAAIPNRETFFSMVLPEKGIGASEALKQDLAIDLAILRIFAGDQAEATAHINSMMQNGGATSQEILRFAAEFFYDYGNPLKAAEIFSQYADETSLARQADALWLAAYIPGARNIWTALVSPEQGTGDGSGSSSIIKARSLYNLAATSANQEEEADYLIRLLIHLSAPEEVADPQLRSQALEQLYHIYGTIRYTRLLDTPQSISILEQDTSMHNPLIDLELLRRQRDIWSVDRVIAETWLLINRYSEDARMYQWGCYLFNYQRRYDEILLLIKNAEYYHISGLWMAIYNGLQLVTEGRLEEGEQQLKSISDATDIWQVPANIARILEARRSPAAALDYYEIASTLVKDKKAAARIQFRISYCLRSLDRNQESRQALEKALELNPDYLNARLELRRMDSREGY
jgi:tetratricopeptide (TPR) repeat protein